MSFEFHGKREMCDERGLLEIELHDKIKRSQKAHAIKGGRTSKSVGYSGSKR